MRKAGFWKSDWFLGVAVSLVLLMLAQTPAVQSLERAAYDIGVRMSDRQPSDRIAVIAIDEVSIANLGRWPWSRELHARMTELLAQAQAKVIVNTVFFTEPQRDPGYDYVLRLIDLYVRGAAPAGEGLAAPTLPPSISAMGAVLQEAESTLNTDRQLAAAIQSAARVQLPMLFELGESLGRPDPLPEAIQRNRLVNVGGDGFAWPAVQALPPIPEFSAGAAGIGHLNSVPDVDGGTRSEALVVRYFDQYYPALSLLAAAKSLNLDAGDIQVVLGEEVRVGNLRIPTDGATQMLTHFYADRDGRSAFVADSFYDVLSGRIPASKYRDKIVLIGSTAAGLGNAQVTPVSPVMAPVTTMAHTVSSILREHFFVNPLWAGFVTHGSALLVALYLIILLPRLSAALAAATTGGLLVLLLGAHFGLMVGASLWIPLMSTAMLLTVGHLLLTTKRFLVTERGKEQSEAVSAESNRMLALAFQGQGQLDMAWDKFRQVPMSDSLLENLYNLALDFERKRQFNKAEAVFAHMAAYRLDFKDLAQRMARAKQLSETVMLGGGGSHPG
ncbi:MAG TPA: CHASE2 domain-containing protein, partial [Rhodocyclaceae bacterium]